MRILDNRPSVTLGMLPCLGFAHERPDWFCRLGEARVPRVHDNLRHDGGDLLLTSPAQKLVLQRLCDLHSDRTLRVSNAVCERHLVQRVLCHLRTQQDETDLRSVAVGHDNTAAAFDDGCDVACSLAGRPILVHDRHMLGIRDQRISTDGDDNQWFIAAVRFRRHARVYIVSAMSALAVCSLFSASG